MVSSFIFRGEYKDIVQALTSDPKMFDSYYECMIFSALHGLLNNAFDDRVLSKDKEGEDSDASLTISTNPAVIRAEVFSRNIREYKALRRIIILNETKRNLNSDDRINHAFRYDIFTDLNSDKEIVAQSKYVENSKIIEGYVYGGLKLLFNKYENKLKHYTDLLEAVERHIHSFGEDTGIATIGAESIDNGDLDRI